MAYSETNYHLSTGQPFTLPFFMSVRSAFALPHDVAL